MCHSFRTAALLGFKKKRLLQFFSFFVLHMYFSKCTKSHWLKPNLKPLSQLSLCQGLQDSTYPFLQPDTQTHFKSTKCDKSFWSMLMLPKQYNKFIYCFQLQLNFSFNLILERKHLIHFSAFISHKLKLWIHGRLIFGNAIYNTSALNLFILNLHQCSLNGCLLMDVL